MEPLFLQPVFQERIWGGTALRDMFNYDIPSEKTGECWAISAHQNGQCIVKNGKWKNKSLSELWENQKELFGHLEAEKFPLLTKILDANDDLSVQVHPNDDYAGKNENGEFGKTECWYVIDCQEDAELVYGHNAASKEDASEMIKNAEWSSFLRRLKIKPGDFFYVPSGTIHALCKNTIILETQQNSDTTYRLYDYDRIDKDGKKRELHLEKSIDVISAPHQDCENQFSFEKQGSSQITRFVKSQYFTVYKWDVKDCLSLRQDTFFMLASVIEGEGVLQKESTLFSLRKGDHFILPFDFGDFVIKGNLQLIVSHA